MAEVIPRLGIRKSAQWVQQPSRDVGRNATRRDAMRLPRPELPKGRSALWKRAAIRIRRNAEQLEI